MGGFNIYSHSTVQLCRSPGIGKGILHTESYENMTFAFVITLESGSHCECVHPLPATLLIIPYEQVPGFADVVQLWNVLMEKLSQ